MRIMQKQKKHNKSIQNKDGNSFAKDKLSGYALADPKTWPYIKYGTHIRYVKTSGQFCSGGFMLKNPFDTNPKGSSEKKRFMKLQNGFNNKDQDYKQWIVAYEDVKELYMKGDASFLMLQSDIEKLVEKVNNDNRLLVEQTRKNDKKYALLEERITSLERLVKLQ